MEVCERSQPAKSVARRSQDRIPTSRSAASAHTALLDYAVILRSGLSTQATIAAYRGLGVAVSKLLMGLGFCGRWWTRVAQTARGGAAPLAQRSAGMTSGGRIARCSLSRVRRRGPLVAYAKCWSNWWSYDTLATMAAKVQWATTQRLGGAVVWKLSGDTADSQLRTSM